MIIQSSRISVSSGSGALGNHVFHGVDNEAILTVQGDRAELDEMMSNAQEAGCSYGIRHFSISPAQATDEGQMMQIVRDLGAEFGFDTEDAVIVEHVKQRQGEAGFDHHWHAMVPEWNVGTESVLDNKASFARQEKIARIAEDRLGHELVVGAHTKEVAKFLKAEGHAALAERLKQAHRAAGDPRSAFTAERHQVAKREGWNLPAAKAEVAELWRRADNGKSFKSALETSGYGLEHGQKAGVWLVRRDGGLVGALDRLAREKRADVAGRLDGVQPTSEQVVTPPVKDAVAVQKSEPSVRSSDPKNDCGLQQIAPQGGKASGSVRLGSGGPTARAIETDTIRPVDISKPGDIERFLRQFEAAAKKQMNASHSIRMEAIRKGSQGASQAAQQLAKRFRMAFNQLEQRGGPNAHPPAAQRLADASRRAAFGEYAAANQILKGKQNDRTEAGSVDRSTLRQKARTTPITAGGATKFSPYDRGPAVSVHGLRGLQARRDLSNVDRLRDLGSIHLLRNPALAGARSGAGRLDHALQPARTGNEREDAGSGLTPRKTPAQLAARNLSIANKKALAVLSARPKVFDLDRLAARIDGEVAAKLARLKARAGRAEKAAIAKAEKVGFLAGVFRTASFKSAWKAADKARTLRDRADQFETDGRYTEGRNRRTAAETKHRGKLAERQKFDNRADVRRARQTVADVKAIRALCRAGDGQMTAAAATSLAEAQRLLRQREHSELQRLAHVRRLELRRKREFERQQQSQAPEAAPAFGPGIR